MDNLEKIKHYQWLLCQRFNRLPEGSKERQKLLKSLAKLLKWIERSNNVQIQTNTG